MTSQDGIEYYKLISQAKELLILAEMMEFLPDTALCEVLCLLEMECLKTRNVIKTYRKNEKKKERLY